MNNPTGEHAEKKVRARQRDGERERDRDGDGDGETSRERQMEVETEGEKRGQSSECRVPAPRAAAALGLGLALGTTLCFVGCGYTPRSGLHSPSATEPRSYNSPHSRFFHQPPLCAQTVPLSTASPRPTALQPDQQSFTGACDWAWPPHLSICPSVYLHCRPPPTPGTQVRPSPNNPTSWPGRQESRLF